MAKGKGGFTVERAEQIARPVLEQLKLTLWDVRFEKEGSVWYLRYFLDKKGGVTIDDCEAFSRAVDPLLDEADPIEQSYTLEVSSPGVERELTRRRHFEESIGKTLSVRLIRPVEGVRDFVGVLTACTPESITLRIDEDVEMELDKKEAAHIRYYYDYNAQRSDMDEGEDEQ